MEVGSWRMGNGEGPAVAIVIPNWNGEADTIECLESLRQLDYPNYKVIVVDNASTDGSPQRIKSIYPQVTLIENEENLGFVRGSNIGIVYALAQDAAYILLLNNDTTVHRDLLKELVSAAEKDHKTGIVGPKIYFYHKPETLWFAGSVFKAYFGKTRQVGFGERDEGQYDEAREVPFITGCALMFKAEVARQIGLLDPDYYHSNEDVDFCLRARKAGFRVLFVPQAKVWHKVASASGGTSSPLYLYYPYRNRFLLMKKHGCWYHWPSFMLHYLLSALKNLASLLARGNCSGGRAVLLGVWDSLRGRYGKKDLADPPTGYGIR